jgi:hypothetical protein
MNKSYEELSKAAREIGSSLTLNQEIYSTVRDKIKEKLGNRTHAYVENLEIPPDDI